MHTKYLLAAFDRLQDLTRRFSKEVTEFKVNNVPSKGHHVKRQFQFHL